MKLNKNILILALIVLLSSCGGSGSDTISAKPVLPEASGTPSSGVTLNSNNVERTTKLALSSVFNNLALVTSKSFTGVITEQQVKPQFSLNDIDWVLNLIEISISKPDSFTGVVATQQLDCDVSGTLEMTINLQDPLTITPNDSFSYQATNCNNGSTTINGEFTVRFTKTTDFKNLQQYSTLGLIILYDSLKVQVIGNTEAITIAGIYSIVINQDLYSSTIKITAPLITVFSSAFQQAITNMTLETILTKNTDVEAMTISSSNLHSLLGDDSYTITSIEEIQFHDQQSDVPSSGSLKITTKTNASILITILSNSDVQLDTDFDGNNTVDDTRVVTWASLN
ncbi:MAG: hypothetical protein ACSHW0_10660 [Thalassotalea sp.]